MSPQEQRTPNAFCRLVALLFSFAAAFTAAPVLEGATAQSVCTPARPAVTDVASWTVWGWPEDACKFLQLASSVRRIMPSEKRAPGTDDASAQGHAGSALTLAATGEGEEDPAAAQGDPPGGPNTGQRQQRAGPRPSAGAAAGGEEPAASSGTRARAVHRHAAPSNSSAAVRWLTAIAVSDPKVLANVTYAALHRWNPLERVSSQAPRPAPLMQYLVPLFQSGQLQLIALMLPFATGALLTMMLYALNSCITRSILDEVAMTVGRRVE